HCGVSWPVVHGQLEAASRARQRRLSRPRRWTDPGVAPCGILGSMIGQLRNITPILLLLACSGGPSAHGEAEATADVATAEASAEPAPADTRGLDSTLVAQAFERAAQLPRLYSLLVARHGEIVREDYYNGRTAERNANLKSASKSIISALVGI